MSLFFLTWSYLMSKPLNTALNILLLSLGIAVITVLLLFSRQLEQKIDQTVKGIDLVVGAKGSPLQLILCNIFHIDFPTGNINLAEAEKIAKSRLIEKAIPLALGDSYHGYRIIGTTRSYAELYQAEISEGAWWTQTMEVTAGANIATQLNLRIGDKFISTHGLTAVGHAHEEQQFVVRGIMKATGSILDNLILTNVQSIWAVHDEHGGEGHQVSDSSSITSPLLPSYPMGDSTKEITSMLLFYRGSMAVIQLPRIVNLQTSMQAASPAFETARLFSILGVGVEVLRVFAFVLIVISALSIFIALYNSLKERRYDLAIMRSMGATKLKLFSSVLLEGTMLTLLGSLAGLLIGHSILLILSLTIAEMQKTGISAWIFYSQEWIILAGSLFLGVVCSLIPAVQTYRTDISKTLAGQ